MKTPSSIPSSRSLAILLFLCSSAPALAAEEEKFVFETWSKQKVEAFKGSFTVPENRKAGDSRAISIEYLRLPATGPKSGPPIVYLAGGPGGSGIQAINYRYRMFMAMRKHGDVIALDQRGTGASNTLPECVSRQVVPATTAVSDREYAAYHRAALQECFQFWKRNGTDLAGYNTVQNAQDLDALRKHLGAEKIVLWGTSYGSHLSLAALKQMDSGIAKVIVSSVEGLDQTIKLPARTGEYLERLQQAIDGQAAAKAAYPDIEALIRRVHDKLDRKPVPVKLKSGEGAEADYLLQRRDMQVLAAGLISDPASVAQLLAIYRALDLGEDPPFDRLPARLLPEQLADPAKPIAFEAMPVAMDLASGMSAQRRSLVQRQARASLLGGHLDYTLQFDRMAPELDLGDAFRTAPASDVPVLVFSGTLDGRTDIRSQREAVAGLGHVTIVTIENAGHNLFDEPSTEMYELIDRFMEGAPVHDTTITVDLPDMQPLP